MWIWCSGCCRGSEWFVSLGCRVHISECVFCRVNVCECVFCRVNVCECVFCRASQASHLFLTQQPTYVANDVERVVVNTILPGLIVKHFPKPVAQVTQGLTFADADLDNFDGFCRLFRDVMVRLWTQLSGAGLTSSSTLVACEPCEVLLKRCGRPYLSCVLPLSTDGWQSVSGFCSVVSERVSAMWNDFTTAAVIRVLRMSGKAAAREWMRQRGV